MHFNRFAALLLLGLSAGASASPEWGFDLTAMDRSIRPGDNFYRYANGGWVDRVTIPQSKTSVGLIGDLSDRVAAQVQTLLVEIRQGRAKAPSEVKLGRFYRAFMDERKLASRGASPLRADLARLRSCTSRNCLARIAGAAPKSFSAAPFAISIDPDGKDPTHYAVNLDQSGLGLPDRDYYLEARFAKERRAYRAYVVRMLGLVGWRRPEAGAEQVLNFESRIARVS